MSNFVADLKGLSAIYTKEYKFVELSEMFYFDGKLTFI